MGKFQRQIALNNLVHWRRSEVSCVDRRSSWRCSLDLTPYPLLSTASLAELLGPRRPVHNSPHQPRELGHDVPSSSLGGRWQTGTPFWGGRPLPARVGHLKPTLVQLRCRPGAATDGESASDSELSRGLLQLANKPSTEGEPNTCFRSCGAHEAQSRSGQRAAQASVADSESAHCEV